jgi:hypothetical protein
VKCDRLRHTIHQAGAWFGLWEETHSGGGLATWALKITVLNCGSSTPSAVSSRRTSPRTRYPRRGIGPVVSGNRATDQVQPSVFGNLFDVIRIYVNAGNVLTWRRAAGNPSPNAPLEPGDRKSGMELEEQHHNTSSKMAVGRRWMLRPSCVRPGWRCEAMASRMRRDPERDRALLVRCAPGLRRRRGDEFACPGTAARYERLTAPDVVTERRHPENESWGRARCLSLQRSRIRREGAFVASG